VGSHPGEDDTLWTGEGAGTLRKVKNRYGKGRRNEYKSMRWLEQRGYMVFRVSGSKGPWDLIAFRTGTTDVTLIQVKSNKQQRPLTEAHTLNYHPSWHLLFHIWMDYMRNPLITDARTGMTREGL
jgi:hypothetical protein